MESSEVSFADTKTLTDQEKKILENQDSRIVSDFVAKKIEAEVKKNWDLFYKRNETKFFKDRHWTTREFIELSGLVLDNERKILLEVGCGVGNLIYPLIEGSKGNFKVYACDISPRAVNFLKSHSSYDQERIEAFEADITMQGSLDTVPEVDLVSLVFVLSAVHPNNFIPVVKNIYNKLKHGGTLVFRDYGRYDMAQLRFKPGKKISENLYMRQDGTS
ncbi:methyltransferase-like protein 6 isoform X2 [Cimex lectularius]|uniref:Methyltransferase type 12 domain-containing protein n=1 Tax=Cimex lectularius TaxID=79782 RepID=A0A8I6SL56_CIMLE|nr:methyltransferase-like protein 6 isoform X2 [Cimex lectularius]